MINQTLNINLNTMFTVRSRYYRGYYQVYVYMVLSYRFCRTHFTNLVDRKALLRRYFTLFLLYFLVFCLFSAVG